MEESLQAILECNVPRFQSVIRQRGGVNEREWSWLINDTMDLRYPMHLCDKADEYLLYPKDEKTFNQSLFTLVKALAIMSFIPGGVEFLGLNFNCSIDANNAK